MSNGMGTMADVKAFLSPVDTKEFSEFWKSLSEEEKVDAKRVVGQIVTK